MIETIFIHHVGFSNKSHNLKTLVMKKVYTLLAITLLLSSCKNIQKMVDKGEYDKAIFYAAEKPSM